MSVRRACAVLVAVAAAVEAGCGGSSGPVGAGGKIEGMTLSVGTAAGASLKFFDVCDPVIVKSGHYMRSCDVPGVRRLFVGYGDFAVGRKAIELDWKQSKWELWIDGRPVDLLAFGTSDREVPGFQPAGERT